MSAGVRRMLGFARAAVGEVVDAAANVTLEDIDAPDGGGNPSWEMGAREYRRMAADARRRRVLTRADVLRDLSARACRHDHPYERRKALLRVAGYALRWALELDQEQEESTSEG